MKADSAGKLKMTYGFKIHINIYNPHHAISMTLKCSMTYSQAVRKPIYTTNAVKAAHRQFRKLTKTKGAFPNDTSLLKLLYVGMLNVMEKWTMPIRDWGQMMMQLSTHFPDRVDALMSLYLP